jgi:hypothetical protein
METMTTSKFKKRHVRGVPLNTTNTTTDQRRHVAQTVAWEELDDWQRDNKYVRRGYRK